MLFSIMLNVPENIKYSPKVFIYVQPIDRKLHATGF